MKVKRIISVYDKIKDNLIEKIEIENIPISVLREILNAAEDDFNLFKIYTITHAQFVQLVQVVPKLSELDFDKFELFYECFQY